MKTVRHFACANPRPAQAVNHHGSAVLQALEQRHPALAAEFTALFSYPTDDGMVSLVALGSEMRIESAKDGDQVSLCLRHGDAVERRALFRLDRHQSYHAQVFRLAAVFLDEIRPMLLERHGLAPDTPLLGGWRCGTRPELVDQPLVFTLPRVLCRIDAATCRLRYVESEHCPAVDPDLFEQARELPPLPPLQVTRRQELPECVDYVDGLVDLLRAIAPDSEEKVVLARAVKLKLKTPVAPNALLRIVAPPRAGANYEFVFRWDGGDAWVGISPETLVRKEAGEVVVEPLAGTRKGSASSSKSERYRQELLNDGKEREEHETAAGMFYDNLASVCLPGSLTVRASRNVIDLGYVQHLKSVIGGQLKPGMNIFDVLAAVYPPATIWGKPLDLGGERIRQFELIDRGFFSGGLGYLTLGDDANFALAIRTARVAGHEVQVYAGSGIVQGADPYREWLETSNKMAPFLLNQFVALPEAPEPAWP
ncbi:chorismate-binding protein [Chitiniphilus shinanonensis]|uniref:chorismate-binding protein n=1 Tax=Chitiniphilus shinanonensis TaxID=553088 RepID=UPI003023A6BD